MDNWVTKIVKNSYIKVDEAGARFIIIFGVQNKEINIHVLLKKIAEDYSEEKSYYFFYIIFKEGQWLKLDDLDDIKGISPGSARFYYNSNFKLSIPFMYTNIH